MRWLHISDIHIRPEPTGTNFSIFMNHFLQGINIGLGDNGVDCIIFTGDLFDRGNRNPRLVQNAKEFFSNLYSMCGSKGNWGWNKGQAMNRLYYSPGNHDLIRDAYWVDDEGIITWRKKTLKFEESSGFFPYSHSSNLYKLFTEQSFGAFETIMRSITHCTDETNQSLYPYEYSLNTVIDNAQSTFSIIGLNTSLMAGQIPDVESCNEKMSEFYKSFLQLHSAIDTGNALEKYKLYHHYAQMKFGTMADDFGHLCFISETANNALWNQMNSKSFPNNNKCHIPIVFGHHPIEFLTESAKGEFRHFMESINAHIYLCGHTHRACKKRQILLTPWYEGTEIYQISTGGIFMDESMYNQISFSIGSLEDDQNGRAKLSVKIYTFIINPFGKEQWIESKLDNVSFPIEISVPEPQAVPLDEFSYTENPEGKPNQKEKSTTNKGDENVYEELLSIIISDRHQ